MSETLTAARNGVLADQRGQIRRRIAMVIVVVLTMTTAIVGFASGASAQPGTVTNVDFTDQTFKDGSRQQINVNWEVPGTAEAPVTISIDLPAELQGNSDWFPMMDGGERSGECTVTATQILCEVDDYVAQNPMQMKGSFFFYVDVRLGNTEDETKVFDFGGVTSTVTVESTTKPEPEPTPEPDPGDGDGECPNDCAEPEPEPDPDPEREPYDGLKARKQGSIQDFREGTIRWDVYVGSAAEGIPAGHEVVVTDLLDESIYEVVGDPVVYEARTLRPSGSTKWQPRFIKRDDGITISEDKLTVSFESLGGMPEDEVSEGDHYTPGAFYYVRWNVRVPGGIVNNRDNTNEAEWTVQGREGGQVDHTVRRQGGGADVVGTNQGQFSLTKELEGDAELNPEFEVTYTLNGVEQEPITFSAGETFTSPFLDMDSTVVLEEILPVGPENVTWAKPVFVVDGERSETVTMTFSRENGNLGRTTNITLVNEATLNTGSINLTKVLEGMAAPRVADDATFTVNYEWDADAEKGFPAGGGTVELPANGDIITIDEIPVGAEVTFTEETPTAIDNATWREPVIAPGSVTVGDDATVTVTNTLTQDLGLFSIQKIVDGTGAELLPEDASFTVEYSCEAGPGFDAGNGTLEVPADGTVVTGNPIPIGAQVTLTEAAPAPVVGAEWTAAEFSVNDVQIGTDETVEITLTNTLTELPDEPVEDGQHNATSTASLPDTGAGSLPLVKIAFALLLAGGMVLAFRVERARR